MAKKTITAIEVKAAWDMHEEADPDISTERLIAMTADTCGIEYGDVLDYLE